MLMGASLGHTFPTWRSSVKVGDLITTRYPQGGEQAHPTGVLLDIRDGGYGMILFAGTTEPVSVFLGLFEVASEA